MAFSTFNVTIKPEDGWTLVATNPSYVYIRPSVREPWRLFIGASAPADTDQGVLLKADDAPVHFEKSGASTGVYYIKADRSKANQGDGITFGIIRDQ